MWALGHLAWFHGPYMHVPCASMRVWYTNMHAGRSRTCTAQRGACACATHEYMREPHTNMHAGRKALCAGCGAHMRMPHTNVAACTDIQPMGTALCPALRRNMRKKMNNKTSQLREGLRCAMERIYMWHSHVCVRGIRICMRAATNQDTAR